MLHAWKHRTREREQKHHHRERRVMMHSANEHTTHFFLLCAQAYVNTHFFLIYIFFYAHCLYSAAENKGTRDLSLSLALFYSYIYAQQKSSQVFFFDENDKPDRKSLTHGVKKETRKREKNRFD